MSERSGIRMKQSDVLDRWTILMMKARADPGAGAELAEYHAEAYNIFTDLADEAVAGHSGCFEKLILPAMRLMEANAKVWVLESAIRNGNDMPPEEVGRRAIEIREHNKLRVAAKREIDVLYNQTPDVKVDHASA
jgi:hypothetical protein